LAHAANSTLKYIFENEYEHNTTRCETLIMFPDMTRIALKLDNSP